MSSQIKPDMADRIQVSNDGFPPQTLRSGKRNWRLIGGAAIVVLLAVAALAATFGSFGGPGGGFHNQAEVPLIKAEEGPLKVRPEDPGGMQVPDRDMLVYRRLDGADEPPPVERLLPSAEQPVVPPRPVSAPGREIEVIDEEGVLAHEESVAEAVSPPEEAIEELAVPPEPTATAKPQFAPIPRKPAPPVPSPAKAVEPRKALPPAKSASAAKPAAAASANAAGGYQVQLVAVRSRDQAQASWGRLSKKHGDVLGGLKPNILRADLGAKGVIYRLRAGPAGNESNARAICASLAKRKVDCLVVRNSG